MTTEQAHMRLEAEAQRLRDRDLHAAANDWQRMANEFARLAGMAERLPPARKKRDAGWSSGSARRQGR
jgi:hypothetical protein